jgi:hypothetical protein
VARLVDKHPIQTLQAHGVAQSDLIAKALSTSTSLQVANFSYADLTDGGFRMLPLELLEGVSVAESAVTSNGLEELRRCRQLNWAELDGQQFDESVAGLLCGQLKVKILSLSGDKVTDEDLAQIHGTALLRVVLNDTAVTPQGIATLRRTLSKCQFRVYNSPKSTE